MQLNPASWRLKNKFISILLLVLLIPVVSVFLLKEIENSLVENLKQNLLLSAKLYSLQLEENSDWFAESNLPDSKNYIAQELFVFPLQEAISLDGFFEEWEYLEKFRKTFNPLDAPNDPDTVGFLMGAQGNHLYLSMKVADQNIIYSHFENQLSADQLQVKNRFRSELVVISFLDNNSIPQRVFISPKAPGKIPVKRTVNGKLKIDWRYTAYWVETAEGFNLEIKFPSGFKPTQLQMRYYDVDKPKQKTHGKIIASSLLDLNPVVWPSMQLSQYVNQLRVVPGQRVWVLDTHGRVMARKGDLQPPESISGQYNPLLDWLFAFQSDAIVDHRAKQLRLSSPIIAKALNKQAATTIETPSKQNFSIALAASPIMTDGQVIGAVLIEENVARVQLLQRQALMQLLWVMLAIIFIVFALVAWYVSRLVKRVSRLRTQVTSLVDEQGRMVAPFELDEQTGDEIDELNNAFHIMGNKLFEYHDYLEKLASRLSHELRTPIAIVRSSLDNLLLNYQNEQDKRTIERALEGTERLGEIITRMRQASGVKDAMQSASFETIDLGQFVEQLVAGFKQSFSQFNFQIQKPDEKIEKSVSPDLLAELLDKLLANAMDFAEPGTPIGIELSREKSLLKLTVSNTGPLIPKKNLRKIFQSLVSIRQNKTSEAPNLGLGLYVVKLIAEFHGAQAKAENRADGTGVVFSVIWKQNGN